MSTNRSFLTVWAGQALSLLGSGLTGFALGVWLYQRTGSASNFALVALCSVLPQMLLSPLAGVLVDRFNRRHLMALADSGAALSTLWVAGLFFSGQIAVWHIYLATALSSTCGALQGPAYTALVAAAIRREQLGRANGLLQLGRALSEILAPALAGLLVISAGIAWVLLLDLLTYLVAVATLLFSRLPAQPPARAAGDAVGPGFWSELRAGWQTLSGDPRLMALVRFQALFSFLWSLFGVLVIPMLLGFTRPEELGLVLTVAGLGLLGGSLLMSAWGGPKRRLAGLLGFELLSALAFVLMGLRPSLTLVAAAAFLAHWTLAFVSSLNEALWQSQTLPSVQGRVFALKQAAVQAATLLAYLLAGVLADRVLEPLLLPDGPLAGSLGVLVGVGPGRGIAALFILIGLVKAAAALALTSSPLARTEDPTEEATWPQPSTRS